MPSGGRFERICGQGLDDRPLDDRALRAALLDELRAVVPFDSYAWVLTDPETCVGSSPLAEIPAIEDLPTLIRAKYLTTVNRWTAMEVGSVATLVGTSGGDRAQSLLWSELLDGYGVDDVLSTVFTDRFGCWAFLDVWRGEGSFTAEECDIVAGMAQVVTPALRSVHARSFSEPVALTGFGGPPVVLLLTDGLRPLSQTPATDAYLRALLPTDSDRAPIPAGAYHVGAQLLAREAGVDSGVPSARVHLRDGLWVTFRADRMPGASGDRDLIAVSVEPTPPHERASLYARVVGLSRREAEVLQCLVVGADTKDIATELFVSDHTVQDHLKSIFAKTGTRNRRVLVARATGAA